jgi:predicted acyltransferase
MAMKNYPSTRERLHSLDALRGFDMLWITGGDALMKALAVATGLPVFKWMASQMDHVEWEGFRFYDLIFPLFLFIAGCTIPFSLIRKKMEGYQQIKLYRHIFSRLVLLILLGIIYNGGLQFGEIRVASVLGRIGLAWFFAAVIAMNFNIRWQIFFCAFFLLFYWAVMTLVPVPGFGAGVITPEGNLSGYIDRLLLPGKLYFGTYDPEGLLSTIPAISTALLGSLTGEFLKYNSKKMNGMLKAMIMFGAGILFLIAGNTWGIFFPIIKNLWTSSFVLCAAGWSLMLLAVFYLVIDVWGIKNWAFPFVVIGLNAITIYMLNSGIIDFGQMSGYFFGGFASLADTEWQPVVFYSGYILCAFFILFLLYKYKIFLKV